MTYQIHDANSLLERHADIAHHPYAQLSGNHYAALGTQWRLTAVCTVPTTISPLQTCTETQSRLQRRDS
jgi:hypothetical protein